jgi:hypothetical protein
MNSVAPQIAKYTIVTSHAKLIMLSMHPVRPLFDFELLRVQSEGIGNVNNIPLLNAVNSEWRKNHGENSMIVNRNSLLNEVKCPICLEVMKDVVIVMTCLDRFCSECIERCLRSTTLNSVCPCCRCKIPSRRALRRDECCDRLIRHLQNAVEIEGSKNTDDAMDLVRDPAEGTSAGLLAESRKLHNDRVKEFLTKSAAARQQLFPLKPKYSGSVARVLPSKPNAPLDVHILLRLWPEVSLFYRHFMWVNP